MKNEKPLSFKSRSNWMIDASLLISAVLASLTGIYFLFFPSGGYQGGRNPYYGIIILMSRDNWDIWHDWTGIAMIVAGIVHLAIHWKWVLGMAVRLSQQLLGGPERLSGRAYWNVLVNMLVAISFGVCAVSGLYFFFFTTTHGATDPGILFSRTIWDGLHTWSGVIIIGAGLVHLYIHWGWVTKVTRKFFAGAPQPGHTVSGTLDRQMV